MLAVLLAGLLVAMAPSALADDTNVSLEASLVEAPDKGWYASGEIIEISAVLTNDGDAASIIVDPSCDQVLNVWNMDSLIVDGSENCLGQSRGLDLDAFSSIDLNTLSWDLTDSNGELVPSGDYILEYFLAGEELSSTVNVHVQTPITAPLGLEMEVIATARDGVHAESSPSILSIRLHNSLSEQMDLDFGDCRLAINSELFSQCGPSLLSGHEVVTIAQIPYMLSFGENTFTVSLGDNVLSQTVMLEAVADEDEGVNSGDLGSLTVSLALEGDDEFGEMESFDSEIIIQNSGTQDVSLEFSDSCRGEVWIIDSSGDVVLDSRAMKECSELEVQNLLTPGSDRSYAQPDWSFINMEGCHIAPGELLVVMEIPEHDLYSTDTITLTRDRDTYCEDVNLEIGAVVSGKDTLSVTPSITSDEKREITWSTICGLKTTLYGPSGEVEDYLSECNNNQIISMQVTEMSLESFEFDMDGLEEGEYSLYFETSTAPQIQSTLTFDWPIVDEEIIENDDVEEEIVMPTRVVEGTWNIITNDLGTCWLLNSPDEGVVTLAGAPELSSWSPEVGATGQYLVYESEAAPECSEFATTAVIIEEVYSQEIIQTTQVEEEEEPTAAGVDSEEDEISPIVISVGVVVASSGILSLLVALIATNESWRIPTTSAGLWLLGLIGRTSETSDGRYQRGRLMGYLTANPGCHFRALMAALEMSNGQITHHLKILEDEDRIWRRPDGRLVRFYPYTSNLHPGILEEDLPLPPLSPDPNSLQGKILRLLDDDGQMNKFPTQAELAHRLDRSQQLVSHHLRTLQKFGLVEKQKSGVRNRYCLTREAVFLLDTTEV